MNNNLIGFGAYPPPQQTSLGAGLEGRYDVRTWLAVGVVATLVAVVTYQFFWENKR